MYGRGKNVIVWHIIQLDQKRHLEYHRIIAQISKICYCHDLHKLHI